MIIPVGGAKENVRKSAPITRQNRRDCTAPSRPPASTTNTAGCTNKKSNREAPERLRPIAPWRRIVEVVVAGRAEEVEEECRVVEVAARHHT